MYSIRKYFALAATVSVLAMPVSAYAVDGKGGSSPDCPAKGDQATTAQTCENSKAPSSGGATGNGG